MNQRPSENPNSFFDGKTILAVILVGVVWMGWQSYLQEKYPDAYNPNKAETQAPQKDGKSQKTTQKTMVANESDPNTIANSEGSPEEKVTPPKAFSEQTTTFENERWRLVFSSKGMGLKEIVLKEYTDREEKNISLSPEGGFLPFETNLIGRRTPLEFNMKKTDDLTFYGVSQLQGLKIEKTYLLNPQNYTFDVSVVVNGESENFSGLVHFISKKLMTVESSFLMPSFNQQEIFVAHSGTTDREYLMPDAAYRGSFAQVGIAALSEQYFALAIADKSDVIPELTADVDLTSSTALARLNHSVINRANQYKVNFTGFAGPKDLATLQSIHPLMAEVIDFGWFSWLAVILFDLMQWFYQMFGNYGVAIILLTILVRLFVLPFNMMSYKSMKRMQVMQPELKAMREKYKDDPQAMNRETMALMKEHKANPMGGCLPMLLQFPVFIALYRVFGASVDLYKAPFAFWIHDLSLKDPYYVLPVVMAVVFYFQTKLTPSTMDPNQQKIMMFMPVMFAFFMAGLPSALTLYMFVSTLFGFVQQLYFMKDKNVAASVTEAKA